MMNKQCLFCGLKFEAQGHRLYCSSKCQKESKNKKAREEWRITRTKFIRHPNLYQKEKNCSFCNKFFIPDVRHPNQKTCSKKCSQKLGYKLHKQLKYMLQEKKCVMCGKLFLPDRNHPQAKTCSLKCNKKFYYGIHKQLKHKLKERACQYCGQIFLPDKNHPIAKCCSTKCRNKFWAKRNYERSKKINIEKSKRYRLKHPEKIKEYTKKLVESGKANINAKQWREKNLERAKELHRRQYWKHREKNLDYAKKYRQTEAGKLSHRADSKRRQYARKSKLTIDFPLTRTKQDYIRNRDNNACVYCHEKPNIITFDHIVAQENKGNNSVNNLVVSCISCNTSKRHILLERWLKSEYCKMKGINISSLNTIVWELLKKQKQQIKIPQ